MIRSKRIAAAAVADGELLYDVITGVENVTRRITEIWCEFLADRILRGYIDTDRVVDVHTETEQAQLLPIPVDHVLEVGQTFSVGWLDESSATTVADITVFWEET